MPPIAISRGTYLTDCLPPWKTTNRHATLVGMHIRGKLTSLTFPHLHKLLVYVEPSFHACDNPLSDLAWQRHILDHLLSCSLQTSVFCTCIHTRKVVRLRNVPSPYVHHATSLRDVGSATKALRGCRLGFFGVLHTWGRDPTVYHPHIHFVVPGGGVELDEAGNALQWKQTPENFLLHHGTLVSVYKAKLADLFRQCDLYAAVPAEAWQSRFVVDIMPVGNGQAVLKYLAPYVHRVAISDNRIVACDDSSVTFRYTPSGSRKSKTRTIKGTEFVRGFVQHILPKGLQKVRHYGWMAANSRTKIDEVHWLVWLLMGWTYWLTSYQPTAAVTLATPRCTKCGGELKVIAVTDFPLTLVAHSLPYLDSG